MKKFLAIFLSLLMVLTFAACSKDKDKDKNDESTTGAEDAVTPPEGDEVTFHGVKVVIPKGLDKKEADEGEEEDAVSYANENDDYIELTFAKGASWDDAKAEVDEMAAEAEGEPKITTTKDEIKINGKDAYRVIQSGTFADTPIFTSVLIIKLDDGICSIFFAGSEKTMNTALEAALKTVSVG